MRASDQRGLIGQEMTWVSDHYADDLGWLVDEEKPDGEKYIVPEPIVEAVFNLESEGGDVAVNDSPAGAIGPMQILPSGQEASYWSDLTGDPLPLSRELLKSPEGAFRVGAVGLGKRYEQITGIVPGAVDDWYYAGAAYFGCIPDAAGKFSCKPDAFGTTGEDYFNSIKQYVHDNYPDNVVEMMDKGQWGVSGGGGFGFPDWGDVVGGVTGAVSGVAGEVLDGIMGFVGTYLPRAGIGVIGLVVVGIALYTFVGGDLSSSVDKIKTSNEVRDLKAHNAYLRRIVQESVQ